MQYFDHSTSAASDSKIIALRLSQGGAAVDCYWVIVEQIHRDEKPLNLFGNPVGFSVITHLVSASVSEVETWVKTMLDIGLLKRVGDNGEYVISDRMEDNISNYHAKAETARQNGKMGGRPKKTQSVSAKKPSRLQQNKTKQNKSVGFDSSQNPTLADVENAAEKAVSDTAENVTPYCSKCGLSVRFKPLQNGYECMTHGLLDREDVVFRG